MENEAPNGSNIQRTILLLLIIPLENLWRNTKMKFHI